MNRFYGYLLYNVFGWKKHVTEEHPRKYIICLAPHTSNWDFIIAQLYARAEGFDTHFLMKKEWFFWPLGVWFRKMGGIPVTRGKSTSMTEQLVKIAQNSTDFRLTITPEGTRKAQPNWKRGFYFIAQKADIPILLYGLDYDKKLIECTKTFRPTGDINKEMPEIKRYFKDYNGKHRNNFTTGLIALLMLILGLPQLNAQQATDKQVVNTRPWVQRVSSPVRPTEGLYGHHLAVWPSHGSYYKAAEDRWRWQRPQIFCTTEDLFTQTFVYPYLVPMLENAGANIFVPRERDWQTEEYIVDNDIAATGYMERNTGDVWKSTAQAGFGLTKGRYRDGDRPFAKGTARMISTTTGRETAKAFYKPNITKSGRYAVYVSYQTVAGSVDDAEYIVVHQGKRTTFRVNQQMGSGTWVYLGTFDFDEYSTFQNHVIVTNHSSHRGGIVTTDAVRFGGGMGDHERGGRISHLPRAMECSRYYNQFAGAPRAVVCSKGGADDYGDDINTRSLMSNWISYGSYTNPTEDSNANTSKLDTITVAEAAALAYLDSVAKLDLDSIGRVQADSTAKAIADSIARIPFQQINVIKGRTLTGHVPLELQLAIHSDAGWQKDFKSIYGTLGICTSDFNSNKLASGQPRKASYEFACDLVNGVTRDLQKHFQQWVPREVWDRNYSETRLPAQSSAILEMMSHENFPDIRLGHDPYFKFIMSRAIYKVILKYIARKQGLKYTVQPLPPTHFAASSLKGNKLTLNWRGQTDPYEITATPTSYNLYTRIGDIGYDNGVNVKDTTHTIVLQANKIYRFKVTAVNNGGESFPTEELVAMYNPVAKRTVMIVNAFHRLSSPTVLDNDTIAGFDLDDDIGLSYGKTPAWCGHQKVFSKKQAGKYPWLGLSGDDLNGRFTAGNDFNYCYDHADAIAKCSGFNIVSLSSEVFDEDTDFSGVSMVDVVFGNEKDDGHSLRPYKTFTPQVRSAIERYQEQGGSMLISGSYIASDMQTDEEKQWLADHFFFASQGVDRDSLAFRTDSISDMIHSEGLSFSAYRHVNADHYASVASDVIVPSDSIVVLSITPMMSYSSGRSAAVAHGDQKNRTVAMGFPFECIKEPRDRKALMQRILDYLFNKQ